MRRILQEMKQFMQEALTQAGIVSHIEPEVGPTGDFLGFSLFYNWVRRQLTMHP